MAEPFAPEVAETVKSQSDLGLADPCPADRRRSYRVQLRIPLRVTRTERDGKDWEEMARTEVVSRHGGSLVLKHNLCPGNTVILCLRGDRQAARVVGQVGICDEGNIYGVAFLAEAKRFWGISFPEAEQDSGIGTILAYCGTCFRQEVLHLNEIEMMVYESNQFITRWCMYCNTDCFWYPSQQGQDPTLMERVSAADAAMEFLPFPRSQNDRKHPRLNFRNTQACIQRPDHQRDVVKVLDLSRGGVRFLSFVDYPAGSWVQVAVPYMEAAGNVFVPARVIRVTSHPAGPIPGEFALAYMR